MMNCKPQAYTSNARSNPKESQGQGPTPSGALDSAGLRVMPIDALGQPRQIAKTAVDTHWLDAGDSAQCTSGVILVLGFPTSGIPTWGWDNTHVYDDGAKICRLQRAHSSLR